jgi:hypothetical protein
MDRKAQSTISRWSIALVTIAAASNVLSVIFENYQFYYLRGDLVLVNFLVVFIECISLMPLVVWFIFRQVTPTMLIYAFILFGILAWRSYYLVQYYSFGARSLAYKIDMPGLLLAFLGAVSVVVILARGAIHLTILLSHWLKRGCAS